MPPRRAHKKSRTGCVQCKERRVKCDESVPCLNCARRGLPCRYAIPNGKRPGASSSRPDRAHNSQTELSLSISDHLAQRLLGKEPISSAFDHLLANVALPSHWSAQDPELMYHYCMLTSKTLSRREEVQNVWQNAVPKISFSHEYLMHGILALSALHIALETPERCSSYLTRSSFHLALGLRTFRTLLHSPTPDNCCPLFAFSGVMIIYAYASPVAGDDALAPLENIVEVFKLCRGILVLEPFMHYVREGPLRLFMWDGLPYYSDSRSLDEFYREFLHQIHRLRHFFTIENIDATQCSVYNHGLSELESSLARMRSAGLPLECGMAFLWPISVRDELFHYIQQKCPYACLLLAFYCVQLRLFRDFWFLRQLPQMLLESISVCLPARLSGWLEWPRAVLSAD
ncbi:C6 transcription factor [Aspergillus bertholletiae]|uniref:C6 transcription factor n=1 Tax=Aspergillus bertholletiae TaxID=1226010 RepID=A0A5N7B4W5_9EURO|nr:C6 transcription factor [Aspergillus bertholletiae]